MTAPRVNQFDPKQVTHWINVLHNAAQVPQGDPDYEDAQAVVNTALLQIQHLNRTANQADRTEADQPGAQVNPGASFIGGMAHGASLGLGEPFAGIASALTGGSFREGAEGYREGLGNLQAANPEVAFTGEVSGGLALPGARAGRAAIGIGRAAPVGVTAGRVARGALAGAVPGAIAGFSGGGEDAGDLEARLQGAGLGAAVGGVLGGGLAGISGRQAQRAADLEDREVQREINRARLARLREPRVSVPRVNKEAAAAERLAAAQQKLADHFGVPVENIRDPNFRAPAPRRSGLSVGGRQPSMDMESPAFRRRATDLGQPQRAVPEAEVSGVGNPPVNPEGAAEYVRSAQRRLTPEGQAIFGSPPPREAILASLDLPPAQLPPGARRTLPSLTLERGGRFSRKGSQMATRQLPPEQQRALERLVVENLLESPRLGQTPLRAPRGMLQADAARLVEGDLRASAEVRARVQQHAPKGRGAYRAQQLARGPSPKPSTEEIAARQFEMLRQAAESGDEDAIRAIEALTGLGGPSPRGPF